MGGSWRMGGRYPASTSRDGRASRFTRPVAAAEGSRPRDVRSDNGITGGLRAEKARFDVRRRAPERVRRVGGPDLAVTGGPVLTAHSEGAP